MEICYDRSPTMNDRSNAGRLLNSFKKRRDFTCRLCEKPFQSMNAYSIWCSTACRVKGNRLNTAAADPHKLTVAERRGPDLRGTPSLKKNREIT